jgi:hypothetical protein
MLTFFDIADRVALGSTNEQIAAYLPTTAAWRRPLLSIEALRWLSKAGRMAAMEAAAEDDQTPIELKGAIRATLIALQRADTSLDLRPNSDDRTLLLGCASASIFALADVQELIESTRLRPDPTAEEVAAVRQAEEDRVAAAEAEQVRLTACGAALTAYGERWRSAAEAFNAVVTNGGSAADASVAFDAAWGA